MMEFDKALYDRQALWQAVQDYTGLANITVCELESSWRCAFSHCWYGDERTQKEFANYVLDLTAREQAGW